MENQLSEELQKLQAQIAGVEIPNELRVKITEMLARLNRQIQHGTYTNEYEQIQNYINWVITLPWNATSKDQLDLGHAKEILDSHHYGLEDLKERILEYLSILIMNEKSHGTYRAPILLLVGLVGTGKTTMAASLAEALGRKFVRIPFGGMSSALDLRGQSRIHAESEPGQIIKSLRRAGTKNPVILLDEIDRIAPMAIGEIMGVLVELLDPQQNNSFVDHYLDYPFDLSQALFIGTANHTANISVAVMDRLEPITMPSYTDMEKTEIARKYVFPLEMKKAGLPIDTITLDDAVWPKLVRPLGFDAGIRTLERTVQGMVRKIAKMVVEGKGEKFHLTNENIKQFLPTY